MDLKLLPLEAQIGQTGVRVNAKLMKLNQARPAPLVRPIPGDLFVTVKDLIQKLGQDEHYRSYCLWGV